MSGNDFKNRKDFRWRRKIVIEDDDWTSAGKEFHSMEAATENVYQISVSHSFICVLAAAIILLQWWFEGKRLWLPVFSGIYSKLG